jgi:hypothetical protein
MTRQEFLDKLKEVAKKRKFSLFNEGRLLRTNDADYSCPIIALCGEINPKFIGYNSQAADLGIEILGLSDDAVQEIVWSSDFFNGKLRQPLLEACGLCSSTT